MRGTMPNDDHVEREAPRGAFIVTAVLGVIAIAVAVVAFAIRSDSSAPDSDSAQPSSSLAVTTTSLAEKDEVVSRLRDILEQRDRAYRERNVSLLRKVYSVDCPCLRGDGDAIEQLLKDDAVWIGASTSVRVKRLQKVNDRLWIVVADFIASPFRIETESGDLVRAVDGRTELFRFVLARPAPDQSLILGFAAPVDEG
jgi:ketosteroid isomerase-like protein